MKAAPQAPPSLPRLAAAEFVASAPRAAALPPPVSVEIAFAGRSNVGKSSLLNALMERKGLARTSSTPGCTREVVLFRIKTREGAILTFADLPGYGYAKRSKSERRNWGELMEDYLLARPTLSAVVLLVDCRRGIEEDDQGLLDLVASPARTSRRTIQTLVVATKLDKLPASERKLALERLNQRAGRPVLGFSESDRKSHEALWRRVQRLASLEVPVTRAETAG
jgi:GTP-binding protein